MAEVDDDLLECIRQLHDAVLTLAEETPGGLYAMEQLNLARKAFVRFE